MGGGGGDGAGDAARGATNRVRRRWGWWRWRRERRGGRRRWGRRRRTRWRRHRRGAAVKNVGDGIVRAVQRRGDGSGGDDARWRRRVTPSPDTAEAATSSLHSGHEFMRVWTRAFACPGCRPTQLTATGPRTSGPASWSQRENKNRIFVLGSTHRVSVPYRSHASVARVAITRKWRDNTLLVFWTCYRLERHTALWIMHREETAQRARLIAERSVRMPSRFPPAARSSSMSERTY